MADDVTDEDGAHPLPEYSLRGWFGKLSGRRWLRLFVFEFFVILLGVLAAQGLQAWFAERGEQRAATAAKATLDRNLRSIALSAEVRLRERYCFTYRLNRIGRSLVDGTNPSVSLSAPDEALVLDFGWSGNVPSLIAEHFDPDLVERYANIALWADSLRRAQDGESRNWSELARLSPDFGKPTASDLSIAKGALLDASRNLREIDYAATHLRRHSIELGVEPDLTELTGYRGPNSDSCKRAIGYSLDEHVNAGKQGRLVTGEEF